MRSYYRPKKKLGRPNAARDYMVDLKLALMGFKKCGTCQEVHDINWFGNSKANQDTKCHVCKICTRGRAAVQNAKRADIKSEWQSANLDRYKTQECYDRNNANRRERRAQNPDKYLKHDRDRRARYKGAKGHHTQEQLDARYAYYGHKCIYCGCGGKLTLEHLIPLVKGGTHWASNLAPSCRSCNSSKGDKTHSEYLAWLQDNS